MMGFVEAVHGLRRYLRQATGEAKWDEYVARCAQDGVTPMTRRDFERHRVEHREGDTGPRCC